jgi:transcriptional regulator GlxA family with amidase domain
VLLLALTPILVTAAFAALTLPVAAGQVYAAPAPATDARSAVTVDPAKPTAVIVLGPQGTNVADSLPPFEVLAATHRFNVLLAATTPGPAPLAGGVDVVPHTTFEQLATLVPDGPDVVIVPQLKGDPAKMKPVLDWLRQVHAGPRPPLMVSVCVGARQLAEAGILDRRPATSHWLGMIGLRRDFAGVRWRDDVTYVDDGDVITSAGVLFGIDATLRVVERLTDQQTAAAAADAIHWDHYSPGRPARIDPPHLRPADAPAFLSAAYRWDRPSTGVLLTEGIGETEVAAALRPYTELSYLDHSTTVTMDGRPVRTAHGLALVPHGSVAAPERHLDRLLVPGHTAEQVNAMPLPDGLDATVLQPDREAFAFDGSLQDIARTTDVATARWVAKSMQYPTAGLTLDGHAWPWGLTARAVVIALTPVLILIAGRRLWLRRRTLQQRIQ